MSETNRQRRWWRRSAPAPATAQAVRILEVVQREGQLGERPAAFYLAPRPEPRP